MEKKLEGLTNLIPFVTELVAVVPYTSVICWLYSCHIIFKYNLIIVII